MHRTLCSMLLGCAAAAAGAAEPADLRALCPGVDAALQEALAPNWFRNEGPGTVRVEATLDGRRVAHVAVLQGPRFNDRLVRQAVRALDCPGNGDARRVVAFDLRFVEAIVAVEADGTPDATLAQRDP